jgi:hypothetical protein
MSSGGGPGLQSRAGGNCIVPGGFDSHPFCYKEKGQGIFTMSCSCSIPFEVYVAIVALLVTAFTAYISFQQLERGTRPNIIFGIKTQYDARGNSRGEDIQTFFENKSDSDAIGLVLMELHYEDKFAVPKGNYSGTEIWEFPARSSITGHTNLQSVIANQLNAPAHPKNPVWLLMKVYYMRRKRRFWFIPISRINYDSSTLRWKFNRDTNEFVFEPTIGASQITHKVDWNILKKSKD